MCEVAVCKGDDGGHARTCSHVSRCECHLVVCEPRDTQECVCGMELERENATETTTATVKERRPSSGRSCIGNRAGFARRRARGSDRAWHETATCSFAGVRPGPETPAVDVSLSRGRTKARLVKRIWNGWVLQADGCVKAQRGLRSVFCSQSARRRLWTGRAHLFAW